MFKPKHKGQSILEYAILLGVIIAGLLIMQVFIKRGYQGGLKESADKLGEQFSAGGTTIQQTRAMQGDQTIKQEVGTTDTINEFLPTGMDPAKGTLVDEGVYSYSERSGSTITAETRARTESAALEKTRADEYQTDSVQDYSLNP